MSQWSLFRWLWCARQQRAVAERRRTDDEGNHGCAIATGSLKTLDELLDLPYLNLYGSENHKSAISFRIFAEKCRVPPRRGAGQSKHDNSEGHRRKKGLARKFSRPQRGAHTEGWTRRGAILTYVSLGFAVLLGVHLGGILERQMRSRFSSRTKTRELSRWRSRGGGDAYAAGDVLFKVWRAPRFLSKTAGERIFQRSEPL